MAEETAIKPTPEDFSPATAREAITELYDALPKNRRGLFIGHLNEALVVLEALCHKAGITAETVHLTVSK